MEKRIKDFIRKYDSDTYFRPKISERKLKRMASRLVTRMLDGLDGVTLDVIYQEVE